MLSAPHNQEPPVSLATALGEAGEKEYRRLLRAARMGRGRFALFPIESNLSAERRDALLTQFEADLAAQGQRLRRIALSRDHWHLLELPEMETPVAPDEVVALIGLEETPGIIGVPGRTPERPPALALLNHLRETLRQCIPAPFFLWCPSYAYDALMAHAPDFFDHFVGVFHFQSALEETLYSTADRALDVPTEAVSKDGIPSPTMVAFYRQSVAQHPEPTLERARALLDLSNALIDLRSGNLVQQISEARDYAEEAVLILAPEQDKETAYRWARGQVILGNAYANLPTGDREANLQRAIECYEAALKIYNEADFPSQWAASQGNLGDAYANLPTSDREANLQRAIECYEATLRVRTEQGSPFQWARIQNNLGTAYARLPTDDREANLQRAFECFQAALKVWTEQDFPYEWAGIQHNLGLVYARLPTGDREANLQQAIACYQAALRMRTEEGNPVDYGHSHFNLGHAYTGLGETERAKEHFQKAVQGYVRAGVPPDSRWHANALRRLSEL